MSSKAFRRTTTQPPPSSLKSGTLDNNKVFKGGILKAGNSNGRNYNNKKRRRSNSLYYNRLFSLLPKSRNLRIALIAFVTIWFLMPFYIIHRNKNNSLDEANLYHDDLGGLQQQFLRNNNRKHSSKGNDDGNILLRKWKKSKKYANTILSSSYRNMLTKQNHTNEIIDMTILNKELPFDNPDGGVWKQGWDLQPKQLHGGPPLEVIVVPHSHCDPGWIKTFDEYFQTQTKNILSSVVTSLSKNPKRSFVWAEISYFEWWWKEQNPKVQELTRSLLKNKQFEFVTGGWVMPDEANTQLYAMEIQLQEGHDFIRKTFGEEYIPKYSWSIDPFGYSSTYAYLLKKYGFRGMLIQRVHYAIKKELAKSKHLEFLWRQTWDDYDPNANHNKDRSNNKKKEEVQIEVNDEGGEYDIFTHVMPFFSYDVPHTCGPDPSICCQFDFARSQISRHQTTNNGPCPWHKHPQQITDSNVKERSMLLLDQYLKKASLYRGNALLVPLGDDFRYQSVGEAEDQFTNYEKMFDYINKNVQGVHVQFGTLSDYFDRKIPSFTPPLLKGSFFTYSDVNQDYWSGYFTSRVFDKALDRKLERYIYAATTMGANEEDLQLARRSLSLFQHHDGVTGTAKDHVVTDYAKRIHEAIMSTQQWMVNSLQKDHPNTKLQHCLHSNVPRGLEENVCENKVLVYNPLHYAQQCGATTINPRTTATATLPCEEPGPLFNSDLSIEFDSQTGLMTYPFKEEWMVWKVRSGGAYLFVPGRLSAYDYNNGDNQKLSNKVTIEKGGFIVSTNSWKRSVIERRVDSQDGSGGSIIVLDFTYETYLQTTNQEWFVRFSPSKENVINNEGVFHTDLNGFNFDTHYFRKDMPIQSQVFPMPTLAAIEDDKRRFTVLSEHAQGTASLQDNTIDVWLDRRLGQDDSRGLGQGVTDNVPTRTRLRVILETHRRPKKKNKKAKASKYGNYYGEFMISPICRKLWDELNHPLEMFGKQKNAVDGRPSFETDPLKVKEDEGMFDLLPGEKKNDQIMIDDVFVDQVNPEYGDEGSNRAYSRTDKLFTLEYNYKKGEEPIVPFVYMVYKRIDYLKTSLQSLINSDFDTKRIPLIISIDGHVEEMVDYVKTLDKHFDNVLTLIHPYSCYDHPNTFPGNDEKLNVDYKGDSYGNKRSPWATCAKHHFAWMINTVFTELGDKLPPNVDSFMFMEEDYTVAPTIYETVITGLELIKQLEEDKRYKKGYFGVTFDPFASQGLNDLNQDMSLYNNGEGGWFTDLFVSGPMAFDRTMFKKIQQNANYFCNHDDYNWDWSIVHMQGEKILPSRIIIPSRPQVSHIGTEGGMHSASQESSDTDGGRYDGLWGFTYMTKRRNPFKPKKEEAQVPRRFTSKTLLWNPDYVREREKHRGFGGWGHPADQQHCMEVLGGSTTKTYFTKSSIRSLFS